MRIAITGATGNVGSALLHRLVADSDHELVGVVRRVPDITHEPYDAVRWVSADLTDPGCAPALQEAFSKADAVVHLAWGFQPSHDLDHLEALGVGGTGRVLEAIAGAGVPHLVHMSSVGAYSPRRDARPVDEGWPTGGVTSSPYSRHKVAAERLLDDHQRSHPTTIARLRPGIIGQGAAGSALLRYGVPAAIPAAVLGHIPVLPLDRRLEVPMVHADDVADAIVRVLDRQAAGAFNLAADPPVTVAHIARALGARHVQVPFRVLRGAASLSWHARLQQVDPGWVDLGYSVPLLDTSRAREELGWSPSVGGVEVLEETLAGMRHRSARRTPVLRPRTVPDMLARALRRGPVSERHEP